MQKQIFLVLLVELTLVILTTLLLVQPVSVWGRKGVAQQAASELSPKKKNSLMMMGWATLSLTFCWSVLVGGYWAVVSRYLELRR